jgi:hypothetical protein
VVDEMLGFERIYEEDSWDKVCEKIGYDKSAHNLVFNTVRRKYFEEYREYYKMPDIREDLIERPFIVESLDEMSSAENLAHKSEFCIVFRDLLTKLGINEELFSLDYFRKHKGEETIDVNKQNPIPNGFLHKTNTTLAQVGYKWKIERYIDY